MKDAWTGVFVAVLGLSFVASAVWAGEINDGKQVFFGDLHVVPLASNRVRALNLDFYVRSDAVAERLSGVEPDEPSQSVRFTGFEFTFASGNANLHRDLILQSLKSQPRADKIREPFDASTAEDLWRWMDKQRASGIESLSIVNASLITAEPSNAEMAAVRARNEPLAYVTQAEGAVRDALKKGLLLHVQRQLNPYKFGLVGAGLTGVWAQENSRPAIYAALRRKETFATTDTKLALRMFAGFRLPDDLHVHPNKSAILLRRAVPMGGELSRGRGPLMIAAEALAEASSGPLQRLDVVKGWTDGKSTFEKVFTLADAQNETEKSLTLKSLWRDPEFDPQQPAFYYLRAFDEPAQQATRQWAYSSPIWYSPS